MKKIFTFFLVCCATFAFADGPPVFEETDEDGKVGVFMSFAAEEPIFEEDDEQEVCDENDGCGEGETQDCYALYAQTHRGKPRFKESDEDHKRFHGYYVSWKKYKANFGMEKLFICFPQKPAVSQSNTLLTAYAYDYSVLYSMTGYYPPVGNISPHLWFDEVLCSLDHYPYTLISHSTFQASCGDWIMDYVAHDYVQNLIIKARAIVTPFNAYTLQCVKPNGTRDYFDYFLDNFWLKCECD